MDVQNIPTKQIKPYKKNARKYSGDQVAAIAESIKQFGWQQPIVISQNGEIVIGHARYEAAKRLKCKEVPCVVADSLSEEELKKLRIADNRLGDMSEFDFDLLEEELDGLDFGDLDLDWDLPQEEEESYTTHENYRGTREYENLQRRIFDGVGEYDIPQLEPMSYKGDCEWIPFNYAKTCKDPENKGVHFFIDDYQFTRLWFNIDTYVPMLSRFKYVLTPDFSMYTDFPKAIQIYNHYRKHWIGAYLQEAGIDVIPTIGWSTADSFKWCFDGEPEGGVIALSSVGVMNGKEKKQLFLDGYREAIDRLHPATIIFYGQIPDECRDSSKDIVQVDAFSSKFRE